MTRILFQGDSITDANRARENDENKGKGYPTLVSAELGFDNPGTYEFINRGVSAEKYEKIYDLLIEELQTALPNLQIMILEPFVLKASATEEAWDTFHMEVKKRAAAAKRIAEKYGLPFIALQERFDAAEKLAPAAYWLVDGVHPTSAGHELIKRA